MANMSYCRFTNTSKDLNDCVCALREEGMLGELNDFERESAKKMYDLCQMFIDLYEEREEEEEEEDEEIEDDDDEQEFQEMAERPWDYGRHFD